MRGAEPRHVPGPGDGADGGAARAQRQNLADLAQFKGCPDGTVRVAALAAGMTTRDDAAAAAAPVRPIAVLVDREGLGDALLKLPFLRAVRRAFPGRPLWWIATHQTAMARELAPWMIGLIDRTIENAGLTVPA